MIYLERAFLPLFIFIATLSGLAFGSIIPILFLAIPVMAMPLLVYSYTKMYRIRYRLLTEDEPVIDLVHFTNQVVAYDDSSTFIKYKFDENFNIIDDNGTVSAQKQIAEITTHQLPELTDAMPANGSARQSFTAQGVKQWIYRFHFKSIAAEFNAIGLGKDPNEAFSVARQVLQHQIREWHTVRQTDDFYIGHANSEILENIPASKLKESTFEKSNKVEAHRGAEVVVNLLPDMARQQHTSKGSPTVLIVEDDPDIAFATESIFKQLGCKTILSDGHDGASHKMSFQDVDFIVLDWMLGDNLSADQLVKKSTRIIDTFKDLRARFQKQRAKVITYSSLDRSKIHLPATNYFDHLDHWQKPVNYSELTRRASELLEANGY